METIRRNDRGAAVADVQGKLASLGLLPEAAATGTYDDATAAAVARFCADQGLPASEEVDEKTWAALLDATFQLGDRTLYLRMPFFHGHDVRELQHALGSLGFDCGSMDGIFGAHTEDALRRFQLNLGLPNDGIVGAATYAALRNLQFTWADKEPSHLAKNIGFARAADVLETHPLCLFGTEEFTRSVAARMSNLALATNPASKIMSADSLLVAPSPDMLLVHIVLADRADEHAVRSASGPLVEYGDADGLVMRLRSAIASVTAQPPRITVSLPGAVWEGASEGSSAQHYAITLLDALCTALLDE